MHFLKNHDPKICVGEVRSLESTGSPWGEFWSQISTCILTGYRFKQKLTPDDMRKWVIMCQWFCDKIDAVPDFFDNVWFPDEAHFLLSGHVNSKNNIFWGSTPPDHCLQRPLHSEVHCLGCHLQIWHHWTILVQGWQRAVCDNQHRVICPGAWQVLDSTWSTERGRQCPLVFPAGWCHPPNLKRIIGMATAAFPWPTDQPQVWPSVVAAFTGLEPPYFYMWGYLKDRVYSNNPQTIPDLKAAIRAIPREECGRVIENFARWIQMCLQRQGAHLEHIFWAPVKQRVFVAQTWNFGDVCYAGLT